MGDYNIPSTLSQQFTDIKDYEISYRTLHPSQLLYNKQTDDIIEFPFASITNKYRHYLLACTVFVQLSEEEKELYMYNPKRLSEDVYGTTELWADILKLNNAVSVADFKPDFIRIYDPNKFKEYLNEVMIHDEDCVY